jgi:hypothetical protein
VSADIVQCKNLHARADVRRGDAIDAHNALLEESIRTDTRSSTHEQSIERAGAWLLECSGFVVCPFALGGLSFSVVFACALTFVMLNTSPLE